MSIIIKLVQVDKSALKIKVWNDLASLVAVNDCGLSNPIVNLTVPLRTSDKGTRNSPSHTKTHFVNSCSDHLEKLTAGVKTPAAIKRAHHKHLPQRDTRAHLSENNDVRSNDLSEDVGTAETISSAKKSKNRKIVNRPSRISEKKNETQQFFLPEIIDVDALYAENQRSTDPVKDKEQSSAKTQNAVSEKKTSPIFSRANDTEQPSIISGADNLEVSDATNRSSRVKNTEQRSIPSKTNYVEARVAKKQSPHVENTELPSIISKTKNLKAVVGQNETSQLNRTENVERHSVIRRVNYLEGPIENDTSGINGTEDHGQRSVIRETNNLEARGCGTSLSNGVENTRLSFTTTKTNNLEGRSDENEYFRIEHMPETKNSEFHSATNENPIARNTAKEREQHAQVTEPDGLKESAIENDPASALNNSEQSANSIFLITDFLQYLDRKFVRRKGRHRRKSSTDYSSQKIKSTAVRNRKSSDEETSCSRQTDTSNKRFESTENTNNTSVTAQSGSNYENERTSPCGQHANRNSNNSNQCGVCGKSGRLDIVCHKRLCTKTYHLECVRNSYFSCAKENRWLCPRHFCRVCKTMTALRKCIACPDSYCEDHAKRNLFKDVKRRYWCKKHLYAPEKLQVSTEFYDEMDVQCAVEVETQSESEEFTLTINSDSEDEFSRIDIGQKNRKEGADDGTSNQNPDTVKNDGESARMAKKRIIHDFKKYPCRWCNQSFYSTSSFRQHIILNTCTRSVSSLR